MRALALGAVWFAACAYDRPAVNLDGAPIDPDAAEVIDALDAVDAIDGAGITDRDGDTIVDGADNCPVVFNRNQDDADLDGLGDVCDLCPFTADLVPPSNLDGDALGDACGDPEADRAQCVLWFDGFGDERTLERYQALGGTWSIAAGHLRQSDVAAFGFLGVASASFVRPRVTSSAEITALGAGTLAVAIASDLTLSAQPQGFFAQFVRQSSGDVSTFVLSHIDGTGTDMTSATAGVRLDRDLPFTLSLDNRAPTAVVATLQPDDQASPRTQVALMDATPTDGSAGLATRGVAVDFDYLLVLADAIGPCPPRLEP